MDLVGWNWCHRAVRVKMVWCKGRSSGDVVRMVWRLHFRWQMSCEGGEVLGGRRFVLLRIWAGRWFGICQVIFGWGRSCMSWFVWDRRDAVRGRCWRWRDIGWFVRHWGDCQLFTCVVDVLMTLFVVSHLNDQI